MAYDSNLDAFRNHSGDFDHSGSTNAGIHQATSGQPCAPQQPNESRSSYDTRVGAYNSAKKD